MASHAIVKSAFVCLGFNTQDKPFDSENDVLKATLLEAVSTMQNLMMLSPFFREGISQFLQVFGHK